MLQAKVGQSVFKRVRFSLKEKKTRQDIFANISGFRFNPICPLVCVFIWNAYDSVRFLPVFHIKTLANSDGPEATVWETFSTLFSFSCFSFELILGLQYT